MKNILQFLILLLTFNDNFIIICMMMFISIIIILSLSFFLIKKRNIGSRQGMLLLFTALYVYGSFVVSVSAQESDIVAEENALNELDNIEEFSFDDLELIDEVEENSEDTSSLADTDMVVISNITLSIDSTTYTNPGARSSAPSKNVTKPELAMKEVTFRKGDSMSVLDLKRALHLSLQNIKQSPYFYVTESALDYIYLDEQDDMGHHKVKVFVNVKQGFLFNFTGGNAYGGFGLRHPTGLRTFYHIGANRVEQFTVYEGVNVGATEDSYSRVFLDFGATTLFYWLLPQLDSKLKYNSLLYGIMPHIGLSIAPFRFSSAVGSLGTYTLENSKNDIAAIQHVGLPAPNQGMHTLDTRNKITVKQSFSATEMYDHYVDFELPYMAGTVLQSTVPEFSVGDFYDIVAGTFEAQVGFTLGIDQAIRVKTGVASNLVSEKNPFVAKVNLNNYFYDTLFINLHRRGAYDETVSIGEKGFMGSVEYRLGLFRTGIFALENFSFYDVGSAADSIDMLEENIRHSVGTGLVFHFFSPVDLMAKASFAFGGVLLNQPDGPPLSFSFEVISRR